MSDLELSFANHLAACGSYMKTTLLFVLALSFLSLSANADDLGGSSHREEMERQGKRLQALDDKLNRIYKLALASMPEKDQTDNRRDREQLRKSQRAWLVYVREQCALEGGQLGGSNSWVSTFAGECQQKEYFSRIGFLQSIADHTFGG
jgi:uncharacterized protein YecT (DUF1311 family)